MIKVVIIDDMPAMQQVNSRLLGECFPDVKLVGITDSVEGGVDLIQKEQPNLVLKEGCSFRGFYIECA
jgi:response regulator of citrate/malate metabolism